jgi:hypothetical protein
VRSARSSCPRGSGAQDIEEETSRSKRALKEVELTARFLSIFFFYVFYNILHFNEFCRTCCLKFLNPVLSKNLEIDSSFFRFFYLKIS